MKVLLIEDELEIIESVAIILQLRWPEVTLISTFFGGKGVELAEKELPDVIILDLGLPDTDGFQVLRQIRTFSDVPLVILTVRGEEMNKIKGLELGADDYIVKPFSPGEFVARLKALVRRSQVPDTTAKVTEKPSIRGKLRIDFASQEVSIGGRLLKISPREYDLLYMLVTNAGMVLSNQKLLEEVFPEHRDDTQFLDVYIKKLRERLEENPDSPEMILSEGGIGYKFVAW